MNVIKEHTKQIHQERLANRRSNPNQFGFGSRPHQGVKQVTNVSSVYSSTMDSYLNTAREAGHNANIGKGVWSVSSRPAQRPYQRKLADVYPRNEYTMMPMQRNAPRFYDGKFMTFDHKDMVQAPAGDTINGRPVVFKSQAIERIQSKKKYGMNLKGESAVPLHLCNDVTSELFQRSLDPEYKASLESRQRTGREEEIANLRDVISRYPDYYMPAKNQHQTSTLHPLNFGNTTRHWVENAYQRGRVQTKSSPGRLADDTDSMLSSDFGKRTTDRDLKSGSVRSVPVPEWYSEFFPKQRVADAMKFMGSPAHNKTKSKEYVLNFNTK